jgi:hypothetical protein
VDKPEAVSCVREAEPSAGPAAVAPASTVPAKGEEPPVAGKATALPAARLLFAREELGALRIISAFGKVNRVFR